MTPLDKYTSTGIKFWRHLQSMQSYKEGGGHTPISTHISPEGACNLKCAYCSVTYRDTHKRLPLPLIQDYVDKLISRGLKAAILTGGGEPTIYKHFNELVEWLHGRGLEIGLITNGTQSHKLQDKTLEALSWVRISINVFPQWEEKIEWPTHKLREECVVGCSYVYSPHGMMAVDNMEAGVFEKVSRVADKVGAKYIRLLPNCLLPQDELLKSHDALATTLSSLNDDRYFHQHKVHAAPRTSTCHQSYFRPYLSEAPWHEDGVPGAVYPCDSVVLNEAIAHFSPKHQLCRPADILHYLDRKIQHQFDPRKDCTGCVFTSTVNMLDRYVNRGEERFSDFTTTLKHENFV